MKYLVTHTDRDGCTFETTIKADAFTDRNGLIYFITDGQVNAMFPVDVVVSVIAQEPVQEKTTNEALYQARCKEELERCISSLMFNPNIKL